MKNFKIFRWISLLLALLYVFTYILGGLGFAYFTWMNKDDSEDTLLTVFITMFLGYNMVLHAPLIPNSLGIVIKELMLEHFQFIHPDWDQAYYLGLRDFEFFDF